MRGHTTRGKTRRGRLAALDRYLIGREAPLLTRAPKDAAVVDVGFGARPWTTLELAAALREAGCDAPVLGVEIDPLRVEQARRCMGDAPPGVTLREGGFTWWQGSEEARLVRAMNILRQYPPEACAEAHAALGARLIPGGLVLEGTCAPRGEVLVTHLLRREEGGLRREALLFMNDFSQGFAPIMFRDRLPQDLRREALPGGALEALFARWAASWEATRAGAATAAEAFARSAEALAQREPGVAPDPALWGMGALLWRWG